MTLALIIAGCTEEMKNASDPEGELVLVSLNLAGEVLVEETPLTRAFTTDDLIGVQVYQGSDYYAYGLFDDVSKMNIFLHTGKTYKFVCSVVKNGKNIVYKNTWSSNRNVYLPLSSGTGTRSVNLGVGEYSLPFVRSKGTADSSTALGNKFVYSNDWHFECLQYGRLATGKTTYSKYPRGVDRYYGEVSGYTAVGNGSLSIPLKRVSFGLTLSVNGITDGNVTITIANSDQTLANNTGIAQDTQFGTTTWSFFDLKSAWLYADNYTENFTVGVVWNRGVGVTQNLGTKTIQFKRNAVNHVHVNLEASTRSAGLAIALEDPEIANEDYLFGN